VPDDNPKHPPEIARIIRIELERIAGKVERLSGNDPYKAAFKKAARLIRDSKPD
jgi:hypothetical protein